jgi:hypothetical protein
MTLMVPADDGCAAAVHKSLAPFAWRSLTPESVCHRAVSAMDAVGAFHQADLQSLYPECVGALVEALGGCRWRSLSVGGVSRLLVGAVRDWQLERAWFDIRLGLLLDGVA